MRKKAELSHAQCARLVNVSVGTRRNSEQARRKPTGAAKAPLQIVAREPAMACRAPMQSDAA